MIILFFLFFYLIILPFHSFKTNLVYGRISLRPCISLKSLFSFICLQKLYLYLLKNYYLYFDYFSNLFISYIYYYIIQISKFINFVLRNIYYTILYKPDIKVLLLQDRQKQLSFVFFF
jgi:hypothetical protein